MSRWLLLSALTALTTHVSADASSYQTNAVCTSDQLMRWYSSSTGTWNSYWWEAANMMSALADLSALDPSYGQIYASTFASTLTNAPKSQNHPGFINDYYDDEGWWGLAWLNVYDLTKDSKYLNQAISIWNDIKGGATTPCGAGGIWWSKDKKYVASIANELYIQLSAGLANRVPSSQKSTYLGPAQAAFNWFMHAGLVSGSNLVVDGLDVSGSTCKPNTAVYSYNQGVILGGAAELYAATRNTSYLDAADKIAMAVVAPSDGPLTAAGILVDGCDRSKSCSGNGEQFKGPFVKNLKKLHMARPKDVYKNWIVKQAMSVWNKDLKIDNGGCFLGPYWAGPYSQADPSTQSVALDAINAALTVTR